MTEQERKEIVQEVMEQVKEILADMIKNQEEQIKVIPPHRIVSQRIRLLIINSKVCAREGDIVNSINNIIKEVLDLDRMVSIEEKDIPVALHVASDILSIIKKYKERIKCQEVD